MEFEIHDDPQFVDGEPDTPDYDENSQVTEEHRALQNQSSAKPEQYPEGEREAQSLVRKKPD